MKRTLPLLTILAVCSLISIGSSGASAAEQQSLVHSIKLPDMKFDLAEGPGRDKVTGYCAVCHGVEYIPMQPKMSRAQWTGTVTKMIKTFGAPIPQEDADAIINYLATAYGTGK
jgi:mono/diheme cytochrome c family protein